MVSLFHKLTLVQTQIYSGLKTDAGKKGPTYIFIQILHIISMGYTLWPKLTKVWFAMEISVFFEALQHPTYPNLISPSGQVKLIFIYIWRKKCLTKDKVCKILPVFPVIYSERYLWQYIFLRTQEGEERSAGPKALLCVIAQHYGLLCSALYLIRYTATEHYCSLRYYTLWSF